MGIDIYPPKADLRARPVPPDWIPTDRTVNHAERARQYVLTNPALFKYLAKGNPEWTLPRHQQWYYEIERDAAQRKGHLNKFLAEVPADDEECFQSTAISVSDQEVVQSYKEKVREPLGVYAIVGDGIHASLVPPRSQWWTGPEAPPVITIHCAEVLRSSETYQFIPLKFDGYPTYDPMGKLFIYEWPEQGEAYGFGVDTGDGIGQDWSVIEGLRKGTALHPHSQCCEWACLAPGSLVVCPDGVRPIESIEAGSRVITRTGATGIVGWTKKTRRPASVEIFTGLATNVPLHLTDDHPVATLGGWVPAGQLHPKDWLRYPVRPFLSLDRSPLEIEYKYKKYQIPFTWEFGFLCGLYLAEGHASHNRGGSEPQAVNFTINRRELPPWLPILQSVCPVWHLGVATPTNTKNARRISISCTTLAKWLKQEFGHTRGKHLPAWLWEAPRAFAEGVAFGMVAGDGSIDRRCNSVNYTSICVSLVVGLRDLALSLGWGLGIISHWKRGKVAGPCWILQFYGESGLPFIDSKMIRPLPQATVRHVTRAFRWGWNKECIYVRVARVLPKGPGEFVDLHVLGEEPSFCTIQAAVHNSPYVKADQLWPMALALGCFYSVFNPVAQRRTQSRVAVECRGNGEIAQKELQMRGWVNFHPWKRYDRKRPMQTKDVHQWGVFTNVWFRSMMMDRLLTTIDEESLEIGSPWFVSEMATLERDVDEQSARAAYKTHDDRIMALGFILFSMTIDDMPGRASYRRSTPNYLPESMIASGGYGRAAMPCASTPPGPATYATYRSPSTAHSGPPEATLGVGAGSSRLGAAAAPAILRKLGMLEAALGRRRGR